MLSKQKNCTSQGRQVDCRKICDRVERSDGKCCINNYRNNITPLLL